MIELTDTNSAEIAAEFVRGRMRAGSPAMGMVMTLIIVVAEEDAETAMDAARQASHEHPARVLGVILGDGRGAAVAAIVGSWPGSAVATGVGMVNTGGSSAPPQAASRAARAARANSGNHGRGGNKCLFLFIAMISLRAGRRGGRPASNFLCMVDDERGMLVPSRGRPAGRPRYEMRDTSDGIGS